MCAPKLDNVQMVGVVAPATRSATTVAGIDGVPLSNCRTCCSHGAKLVITGDREYDGGPPDAIAFATVFLEIPSCLAISAFGNFSLTCNLRIKAQSSKVITSPSWMGAHFSSVTPAQFSSGIDKSLELSTRPGDGQH